MELQYSSAGFFSNRVQNGGTGQKFHYMLGFLFLVPVVFRDIFYPARSYFMADS